jgi:hypothetical protein
LVDVFIKKIALLRVCCQHFSANSFPVADRDLTPLTSHDVRAAKEFARKALRSNVFYRARVARSYVSVSTEGR